MPSSPPDSIDADLLRRYVTQGDRMAMDMLIRRHVDFVYAVARRRLNGDPHAVIVAMAALVLLALAGLEGVRRAVAAGPTVALAPTKALTFGPIREVILDTAGEANRLFDLDTGTFRPLGPGTDLRSAGLALDDALGDADVFVPSPRADDHALIWGRLALPAVSPRWKDLDAADAAAIPSDADFGKTWGLPTGYAKVFRTRDGAAGRLEVIGKDADGRIRLRYQLLVAATTRPAAL